MFLSHKLYSLTFLLKYLYSCPSSIYEFLLILILNRLNFSIQIRTFLRFLFKISLFILTFLKIPFYITSLPSILKVLHLETKLVCFRLLVLFHLVFKYVCISHFFLLVFSILVAPISFDFNKLLKNQYHFKPFFSQIYRSNYL